MKLSTLAPSANSRKRRKVVGRGEASGHGKTSCRGGKGQTARTGGKVRAGFEGGQMPLYRRVPKLGFVSKQRAEGTNRYVLVSISILEKFADGATVDTAALKDKGFSVTRKASAGIKVLGSGKISKKLQVKVQAVTEGARKAIEAAGGTVEIVN